MRAQFPNIDKGRKELLSFLNRRKYREMMLAPLEKKCLCTSLLNMRFHLRDLIGSGHLKTLNTLVWLFEYPRIKSQSYKANFSRAGARNHKKNLDKVILLLSTLLALNRATEVLDVR